MTDTLEIMPVDSAFVGGTLELSTSCEAVAPIHAESGSQTLVDALVVLSTVVIIIFARKVVEVFPALASCLLRWKEELNLDYSVKLSNDRDIVFTTLVLPFCLLINRFGLYRPDFITGLQPVYGLLVTIAVIIAYLLLREAFQRTMRSRRTDKAVFKSAGKLFLTFFCLCTITMLALAGILSLCGVSDNVTGTVLIYVVGAFYFLFLIRKWQIFSHSCRVLPTILYLCGLEILPTGLLIASALIF